MPDLPRTALLLLLLAPLLSFGGCRHDAGAAAASRPSAISTSLGKVDPDVFIERLMTAIDDEDSVRLTIRVSPFASGVADVSYDDERTLIEVRGVLDGSRHSRFVIADGKVYIEQGDGGQFTVVDRSNPSYGPLLTTFPQLGPEDSIRGLGEGIESVVDTGTQEIGGRTLRTYAVEANPSTATGAFRGLAGTSNIAEALMFRFYVDDQNLVRRVETSLNGAPVVVTLDRWSKPVEIHVPTREEIVKG